MEQREDLSHAIVRYVRRTRETVVLGDASRARAFHSDPYLLRGQSKSILCLPIVHQQALVAILYLENELVTGAFTRDRLAVLELLASQAAISLQNAMLYADLEQDPGTASSLSRIEELKRSVHPGELRVPEACADPAG